MHRRLPAFEYIAPETVQEVYSILAEHGVEAKIIAGGTDLLNKMKGREIAPRFLVGLKKITGLDYIDYDEAQGLRIGALTMLSALETSPIIKEKFDILAQTAHGMASVQVRNLATIGGNLANAAPSADMAPPLIALDAKVKLVSPKGERLISLEDFFTGPGKTVCDKSELLTEIQVPKVPTSTGVVYLKPSPRGIMDLAIVGVAVMLSYDSTSTTCDDIRIVLGAVAPTPIRAKKAEDIIKGRAIVEDIVERAAQIAMEQARPISDVRSSAEYRKAMVKILTKQAIWQAFQKATKI